MAVNGRGRLRQVDAVLDEARGVAEREEPQSNSPEDIGYLPPERVAELARPPLARCRSCKAAVYWAVTGTGAAMPVDAEPSADGTLSLRWNGRRVLAVYVDASFSGPRRLAHFARCPDAGKWRKRL